MRVIDSITIRYFRSVYTLSLSGCKDLTVITGMNDVGKSNILKALNLFFCNQSDYMREFNFSDDYSLIRKEEVKRDTIRGQQFISITIRFLRGDRMPNSLPPVFSVTKRWDMHSPEGKTVTDVQTRMQQYARREKIKYSEKATITSLSTFLNRIKFIYVPAIKDERVFNKTLDILQQSLFAKNNKAILDTPINNANQAIQVIIKDLQIDFKNATGIDNFVELPNTLNYTDGLLQINTKAQGGIVTIAKRGDGIRSHYLPKILNYVANHSNYTYIWGFEEPENSYEYRRCIQVADEFDSQYSNSSQVFITSHSPAFFIENPTSKTIFRVCSQNGKTVLQTSEQSLAEELGYIELYKDFLSKVKELNRQSEEQKAQIASLYKTITTLTTPIILTEGKTDAELLKIAILKLGLSQFSEYRIQPIISGENSNNSALLRHLQEVSSNISPQQPVIGMFDRDTELKIQVDGAIIDIRDQRFVQLSSNVFAFAIPVPHNRREADQISIEHYFSDKEIRTEDDGKRLFIGNEFYSTGVYKGDEELFYKGGQKVADTIKIIERESKCYVTRQDGTGNYSISKSHFVDCIKQSKDGFKDISFGEYRKIFDIISSIVSIVHSQNGEST